MEDEKRQTTSSTDRAKVWASFVTTALGVIAGLISSLATASEIFQLPKAVMMSIAGAALVSAFTALLVRRERGSSRLAKLKDEITEAYLTALERSALNPTSGGRP